MLGALVVLPTRELAVQVYDVFAALSPRLGLWTALTAARVSQAAEAAALGEAAPNVLVATPGRLMSHLKDARLSLSNLQFLVSFFRTLSSSYHSCNSWWTQVASEGLHAPSSCSAIPGEALCIDHLRCEAQLFHVVESEDSLLPLLLPWLTAMI